MFADHDSDISYLYSQEAGNLYRSGSYAAARSCINRALEFRSDNSDALYLQGVMDYEIDGAAGKAAAGLGDALAAGTWDLYEASEARRAAFRLFMEDGKPLEALRVMTPTLLELTGNNELYYLYVSALEKTAQYQQALQTARYAAAEFEEDLRFKRAIIRLDGNARQEMVSALTRGAGEGYPLPVLAEAVFAMDEGPARRLVTEEYLERGGTELNVRIEAMRYRPEVSPEIMAGLVEDGLFSESTSLFTLFEYLQTGEEKARLREHFSKFSGTMITGGYNGLLVRSIYRQGLPVEISTGPGEHDGGYRIRFEEGVPVSLGFTAGGSIYECKYGPYPHPAVVEAVDEGAKMLYIMDNGIHMNVLRQPLEEFPVYLPAEEDLFEKVKKLLLQAKRVVTMMDEDYLSDRRETADGGAVLRESMRNVMDRMLILREGLAVAGTADLDQDGRYETLLEYTDGEIFRVLYDGDDNGRPEYVYYPRDNAREEWDFDGDGRIDIREYSLDGIRYLEYDSQGDGKFIRYTLDQDIWRVLE